MLFLKYQISNNDKASVLLEFVTDYITSLWSLRAAFNSPDRFNLSNDYQVLPLLSLSHSFLDNFTASNGTLHNRTAAFSLINF